MFGMYRLVLGTSLLTIAAGTAHAQVASVPPSAQTSSSGQIEEIVVTAQKRSENLQDVPIAVSAVTATQLEKAGVSGIVDLKISVPTLNMTNSAGNLTTSLRGIGSNGFGAGIENPVALYIDGVYYASPSSSLLSLNNINQIEVLKGPQGTLFGRNATGGLIQISTRDPSNTATGRFNVSYSNYNTVSASGYVSGPITDAVFMDLAATGSHQGDGWGTNRFNGKDVYKLDHDIAVRSKLIWEPSNATKFTLIGDYADHRDSFAAYRVYKDTISGFTPEAGVFPSIGYDTDTNVQPFTDSWSTGGSLRWDQKIGDLDLMSLTAYRSSMNHVYFDYDGSAADIEMVNQIQRDRQFSQELQLSSKSDGRLTWLVGGYYFNARAELDPFRLTANDLGAFITLYNKQRTRSLAGYAQATYEIFQDTKLTLGGRYTTEKRKAFDGSTQVYVIPLDLNLPADQALNLSKTFNKFTYRMSLDHRFSDAVLAYASYNRGFKSGGFNTSAPGTPAFAPETLDAFEGGLKMDFFDRRVRLNVAGFYYDYQNVQIQQLNQGAIIVINGAKARDYGLDADLTVAVSQDLRITGGIGWISPKFRSFPNCPISVPQGGALSSVGSCAGNQLPLASKFTGNIAADYTVDLGSGTLDLNGNVYYNSGFYPESDNVIKQASYALVGASITYTFSNGFSLGAYGKNLGNTRVINFETTVPNGTHTGYFQSPRTYGVTAGFKF